MMIDVENIKRKIIEYIQKNGPSLPVKIAKFVEMEPVFASAIISELYQGQQLTMSKMKVGATQLYLIEGQEQQLESFAEEYFKNMEKRAYLSLKQKKYLIDEEQEPAIRVALRSIKDFATPFKYQEKIMWRYNFTPKDEILKLVSNSKGTSREELAPEPKLTPNSREEAISEPKEEPALEPKPTPNSREELTPEPKEEPTPESKPTLNSREEAISEPKEEPAPEPKPESTSKPEPISQFSSVPTFTHTPQPQKEENSDDEEPREVRSKTLFVKSSFDSPFSKQKEYPKTSIPIKEPTPFANEVKSFLIRKHIDLLKELEESRNEFIGIIQINSDLGKVKYLLIARNKKTINDQDIIVAHQKSSEHKMPCYFLHKGKVAKKSLPILDQYTNLVKVQEI